ncbi:glycosyltransferase family 4 protein [Halomonas sp. I5-271120]|uniref:glycosyltransferase family 4 protein n=1 Tax=Halomonas sp. I5-271120 TaxID=3061632 RepID=UPI002715478B|nr:glycosyltransferase family 4 protein [Halomonas sp. I5-271120]
MMSAASRTPALTLLVAGDPDQLTGSYVYDARIAEALRERGWEVVVEGLAGRFPTPDQQATESLERALTRQPEGARVVLDAMVMAGLPEVVARHANLLELTALMHHPLADETGLSDIQRESFRVSETLALRAVHRVIATSTFTAERLADFGVLKSRLHVVEPGVTPVPLANSVDRCVDGTEPARLLCVASLTPRKGYEVLIEALSELSDLNWQCDCIGGLELDPDHASRVEAMIEAKGLGELVYLLGTRSPEALSSYYADADLFVLPSYYEGYGMVVTEALARGLPVITTTGGALRHTLPEGAGMAVEPGDAKALATALRRWFEDGELRAQLRKGAVEARRQQQDWHNAAQAFAEALGEG